MKTRALAMAVLSACAPARSTPQRPQADLQWIGGPTALLELGGSFRLLTDPVLGEGPEAFRIELDPNTGAPDAPIARLAALPPLELADLSLVLLSHAHADHFDATARARLPKSTPLVLPRAQIALARSAGFTHVTGLSWWETLTFDAGPQRLRITAVPAQHAHGEQARRFLGDGNGYWLELERGEHTLALYWTGDTVFTPELELVRARLGRPDVLLPHLGAVGAAGPLGRISMSAAEATELVGLFGPRTIVPLHHSTFSMYREPITHFAAALAQSWSNAELVSLREGERVRLDRAGASPRD